MAITDKKITDGQLSGYGVVSAPDKLTGTAAENKAVFDKLIKMAVAPALNALIEELCGVDGAENIGAQVEGITGGNVALVLTALKQLVDNCYTIAQTDSLLAAQTQALVQDIAVDLTTGIITVTKKDGTSVSWDTAMEKVALDARLDGTDFVLTLADGTEQRVGLSAFVDTYSFEDSGNIGFSVSGTGNRQTITATLKAGSVTLAHLSVDAIAKIEADAAAAQQAMTAAAQSASQAQTSEVQASQSAAQAVSGASQAQSYAVGGTGSRTGEDTDNAWYYNTQAQSAAQTALQARNTAVAQAQAAQDAASRAEAVAGGDFATNASLTAHTGDTNNPHNVTLEQLEAASSTELAEVRELAEGKADSSHSHNIADVTGLQTALDGKAPMYTYGTEDIEAGSASPYETGTLHFVIE